MHRNAPSQRNGFTLIELAIVIVMIGVIASIALPRIDVARFRVNSAFREIGMTLLAAQRAAVLRQHAVVVAIDSARGLLRVHEDRNNNGVIESGEPLRFVEFEEGVVFGRGSAPARPMGNGPIVLTKQQGVLPAITFHRSGSAGEAGGFYITSGRALHDDRYADDARAFEIQKATGRTLFYQYSGGAWRRSFR